MENHQAEDGHIAILLEPGDLVLESIQETCDEYDIDSGVVVSAIGTVRNLNYHYVPTADLPKEEKWRNETFELLGAWEIGTIDGMIANGEPHLHLVAFNGEQTVAGHLEEGCEAHIVGEVVIRPIEGLELERRSDENEYNISQLKQRSDR
ncbi:PPC domain-containing DNA-binding protein [Haloplanus litoreus]|uniref:PPC domain-containing DNA-binding protein n=1 Tax=Haloplanus litoreus TaxID=767515 RepID=A0ABD6A1D6_9EURY